MTGPAATITTGVGGRVHRRRWLALGILAPAFSLLLSLAYTDMAERPGSMVGITTSGGLIAIWVVAAIAITVTLVAARVLIRRRPVDARPPGRVLGALVTAGVAVIVLGPAAWAAGAVSTNAPRNDQVRETVLGAAAMCHVPAPIPAAEAYAGESHTIVPIRATADGSPSDVQPDMTDRAAIFGPLPASLSAVQLIACIEPGVRETLQTCHYTAGGTYVRYGFTMKVSIYAARTAELVDQRSFAGSAPNACPETKAVGDDQATGDDVAWDDSRIWNYLATWTTGPAGTPSPTVGA